MSGFLFFILSCFAGQKKGQKTTQRSCEKGAKKYTYAKGVKKKRGKKQGASPHQ